MADKTIKYSVTADDSPFAAGMKRVSEALSGVQTRFGSTGREFRTLADGMSAHLREVGDSMRSEVAGMGGHFSGLLESVGATRLGFIGLAGAAAAFAAGKAVAATAEMTEHAMDLARVLGSSTNEAQAWRVALEDVGAQQGDLEGAAKGMARQLKENEAEMQAMGLSTRDASGQLRPLNDLLLDGLQILNEHKEGADRALAAQQLFGRGVDTASKLLLVNRDTLKDATQTMGELGLEVGAKAVAAWKDYDAASDRASAGLKGLANTAGTVLMPVVTDLIGAFNAAMPAAITVVRGALGGLVTAFEAVKNGVVVVWETVNAFVVSIAEPVRAVVEALGRAMVGDFRGAADQIKGVPTTITGAWTQAMDRITDSSQRAHDRISAIWSGDSAAGAPEGERGTRSYTAPPKAAGKDSGKRGDFMGPQLADVGYYEQMLERGKLLAAQQDTLRDYGKQQELAYWRDVLQTAELAGKDRVAIQRKVVELELQLLRDQAKQGQAVDAERLKGRQQAALDAVEAARLEANAQVAQGTMAKGELLVMERQFEAQRFDIQREYLQQRLAMVDPTRDPVAYEQASQAIEELERQHQIRLQQIQVQQAAEARANNPLAVAYDAARQSMEQAISGMLQRTQTLRQGLTSIWQGIRGAIAGELAKIVALKVAAFARERRRKNCICSLTMVWLVTSLVKSLRCVVLGSSPFSSR